MYLEEGEWPHPNIPKLPEQGFAEQKNTLDQKMQDGHMRLEESLPPEAPSTPMGQAAPTTYREQKTKIDSTNFRTYHQAVRMWGRLIICINKMRKIKTPDKIDPSIWNKAELKILKFTQKQYYKKEVRQLQKDEAKPHKSDLTKFNVFLDDPTSVFS